MFQSNIEAFKEREELLGSVHQVKLVFMKCQFRYYVVMFSLAATKMIAYILNYHSQNIDEIVLPYKSMIT